MAVSERWLDTVTNNLANASTVGFKREAVAFNESLLREMRSQGGQGGAVGSLGSGPGPISTSLVMEVGSPIHTGNPLDVAIRTEKGFFSVQTPDGARFTRNGSFTLGADRTLVTQAGLPVLDTQGSPITMPVGKPEITEAGEVKVDGKVIAQLGLFDGEFSAMGENLYTGENTTPMTTAALMPGSLEGSNVNAIEEMVQMVKLNRAFELAQKSAASQDESTDRLIQSMSAR
jgi:flagellar basal body rod protein FlgG